MEGAFIEDNKDEGPICQDCSDAHEAEGDGKPGMVVL